MTRRPGLAPAAAALALGIVPGAAAMPLGDTGPPMRDRTTTLTILASGDLLVHAPVAAAATPGPGRYDFRPLFRPIRRIVRGADLALCHVETPLGPGQRTGYPLFNAPEELAAAIRWTGWDACSTASNHSLDRGLDGIGSTRRALRRAGVRATGTARSAAEARRILIVRVRGVRIAVLAYTEHTNGLLRPTAWAVNVAWRPRILADARRARRRGADLVLVNLHWGAEYVHEPTTAQRTLARALLRSGLVDAIVGQHPHVVQPIRRIAGRFVVYGEGNLLSAQSGACCPAASQDGLMAVLTVRAARGRARIVRADYVPTRVRRPDYAVEPVAAALRLLRRRGDGRSARAAELAASLARTTAIAGRTPFTRPLAGLPAVRSSRTSAGRRG